MTLLRQLSQICWVILVILCLTGQAQAKLTVKIGHEQNHPMASTGNDGLPQGILIDIIEEVARREGWTIQYSPCLWNQCLDNLESGNIDLLIAIAYTPERAERFSFNKHTIISNWGMLYSRADRRIETYADLHGKRIALVHNDVYSNAFIEMQEKFNIRCELVYADNFKSIFGMIDKGEVDAGVANRFFSLLNEKEFKVRATPIIFSPVSVQIAATKDKHAELLAAFDRHLERMKKDPRSVYHQSLKRWLGIEGAGYAIPRWLWWLGAGSLGGAVLLIIFNTLLRREVRRKTADLRKLIKAVEQSANSVIITDTNGIIEYANPRFCLISGYAMNELVGRQPNMLTSGHHPPELFDDLWNTIRSGNEWKGELRNKRKDGTLYWELCSIAPVRNEAGSITNFVAINEDISTRKAQEEVLIWQASHDTLTGLYNRYYLESHLAAEMIRMNRQSQQLTLLLIGVDNMKFVNDTFGHDLGDHLLVEIGQLLRQAVCPACLVARFLGDEFLVVPPLSEQTGQANLLASKVMDALAAPLTIDGIAMKISVGIGVAAFPADGENVDSLLRNAETAMYEAKRKGHMTIVYYNSELHMRTQRRLMLETRLHKALENNEFSLHYQPQVCMATKSIIGAEALLRWTPPDLDPPQPTEFIPILEEISLIVPVGQWVMEEACRQAVAWQAIGLPRMRMSLNISAIQFLRGDLITTVRNALAESGLDPALLCIELTESMLMHDTTQARLKLQDLRDLGVSLSLDDFGTGYSSLSYLSRLPVQEIKVDQSFIHRLHETPSDTTVVNTIIAMAQELGLEIVAEGVETDAQKQYLTERNCTTIQGFLFCKPLPVKQFEAFITSGEMWQAQLPLPEKQL